MNAFNFFLSLLFLQLVDPTDNNDSRYPAKSRSDSSRSSLGHNSKSQAETETELLRAKMQIVALKGQLEVAAGSGLNDSDMKPVGRGGNEAFMEMRRVLSREGSRTSIAEVKQSEVEAELERTESIRESGRYRYDMDQTKQERSDRVDSEGQWENAGVRDSRRSSIIGGNNEAADTGKVSRRGSQSEFLEEEYCLSSLERSDYNGRERKEDFVEGAHRRRGAAIGGSDFLRGIELESTDEGDGGAQRGDADLDNRTQVPDVSPPDTSRVNETDGRRGSVRGEGRSQSVGFVEDTNEDKKSRWMSVGSEKSEGFSSIGESHDYVDDIDTGDNVLEVSNRGGVRADGRSSILGSYSNDKEFDMRKRSGLVPSSAAGYATGETGTRRFSDNLQRTDEFDLMSQSDRESRRGTEVVSWWKAIEPRSPPTPSTASQTRSNRRVDSSRTAGKDSGRYSNNGSFLADANVETGAGAESMGTRVPTDNSYNTEKRESRNEESRHGSGRYSAYDMDQTRAERSDRADSEGQWENAGVRDSRRSSIIGGNNEAADTGKVSRRGSQSDNVRTDGRQSSVSFQGDGLMNRVELDGRTQDEKEMLQAPGKHSTDDSRDVKDISSVEKEWGEMEGTTSRGGTVGRSRMSSVGPQVESDTARRISVGLDRRMHSIGGDSQSSAMGDNDIDWDRGIEDNINSEGQWENVGVRENRRSSIIGAKYEDIEELARRGSQSESMSGLREDSISTSSSSSSSSRSLLKNHEVSNYIQSRSRIASVDNRVEKESAVKSDSGDDDFRNISVQLREERSRVKYLQALVDAQSESGEADSNRAVRSGNSGEPLRRSLISNGTRPDTRDLGSAQDLYVIKLAAQDDKIKKLEEDLLETLETSRELEIKMEERVKKLREREERIMDAVDNERSQLELIVRLQEKERHLTEEARDQEERWDKLAARHSKLQDTFAAEKKDLEGQVSELQGIMSQLRSETSQRSDEMKEELLTVYEQRLKAMGESYHLHHTQVTATSFYFLISSTVIDYF